MTRAVVIGSGGGVGRSLVRRLAERGDIYDMLVLSQTRPGCPPDEFGHSRIDVATLRALLRRPTRSAAGST